MSERPSHPLPPAAPCKSHEEVRFGETVRDDYYWLREKENPEVIQYLEAENAYTEAMTAHLKPFEDKLYTEMLARIRQTDLSVPVRRGEYLYYARTEEGKQYAIQCRRRGSMDAPEEVLLDLNELAAGGTFVSLGAFSVSNSGNLLAYSLDTTGFRQYTLYVKDLRTGTLLPDRAERVTSVVWCDEQHLFFTTEDETTKRSDTAFRHALGTTDYEQIYYEADEVFDVELVRTRDKEFVLLESSSTDTTEMRYLRCTEPFGEFTVLLPRQNEHRYYLDHRLGLFYIRTNRYGKNFAVVTAPVGKPDPEDWHEFIPHRPGIKVEGVDLFRRFAVSIEKSEALNHVRIHDFEKGDWFEIPFAEETWAAAPLGTPDFESDTWRFEYQSFVTPRQVIDFNVPERAAVILKQHEVVGGYDPQSYVNQRLWAPARDGERIPVSIVYPRGLVRDGQAPMLLYAYGSYGIGMPAPFSSELISLLDRGVSFAIAHIRGGDDRGEEWREAGMLMRKKNTFFDFIDAAEYLVQEKWTSSAKLIIEGRSAGGLLMGAVVNMRPDLFRAVHAGVPFVDVMNTMLDPTLPLTIGEYLEWGNPNEQAAYDYMRSYSPYDNLRPVDYPSILLTSSLNDSQVMYWEPAKYIAKLRTVSTGDNPLLLKMKLKAAGHGGASGRYDRLRDYAFETAWMLDQVGIHG